MFVIQFRAKNDDPNTMYHGGFGAWVSDVNFAEKFSHIEYAREIMKTVGKPSMTARGNRYLKPEVVEIKKYWVVVGVVE